MKQALSGDDWTLTGWYRNQWRFTRSMELDKMLVPAVPSVRATVPGAVQADLLAAGLMDDPFLGVRSRHGEWVNNREWFYDRSFTVSPELLDCEKLYLLFEGLDSDGEIYLNGKLLRAFSGMFLPVEIEVTGKLASGGENLLRIVFFQSPEVDGQFGFTDRIRHIRSRFGYNWDWCPRIVPVGIWEDVYLAGYSSCRIHDFFPRPQRRNGSWCLHCETDLESFRRGSYRLRCSITRAGRLIAEAEVSTELPATRTTIAMDISVHSPELWYPAGEGAQPLYDVTMELASDRGDSTERASRRIGFREYRMAPNERSPAEARPYTLEVNGRSLFLKGVNWVPLSPFFGTVRRQQYELFLERFRQMGCNLVRVWGGAILEKEAFYDTCDELGLLVWQEFPQSSSGISNRPSDDPDFLAKLEEVARAYLRRRHHHASLAIWCGGNELLWANQIPVDERHANVAMLADLVATLDPGAVFLPASPSGPSFSADEAGFGRGVHHDVHGPWEYGGEERHYRFFNADDSLLRSETGCPAPSRREQLEKFADDMELWPPDQTNPYWTHRGAWWLQLEEMTRMFGQWRRRELDRYIGLARYLQAEALRYAAESTLRRRPAASGFIVWMGNEPFPNNANTSLLEYDGMPKPAYGALRCVFGELHVSARFDRLVWERGEEFAAEVFLLLRHPGGQPVHVCAELLDVKGNRLTGFEHALEGEAHSLSAGTLATTLDRASELFFLRLTAAEIENTYAFCLASRSEEGEWIEPLRALRDLPQAEVTVDGGADGLYVENRSSVPAPGVSLKGRNPDRFLSVEPDFLFLLPGERRMITVKQTGNRSRSGRVSPEEVIAEGPNLAGGVAASPREGA